MLAPAMLVLMACSGWLGLRAFGVPRWAVVAAVACLCMAPLVTFELSSVHTDLPALTWVVTTAGLCAAAARGGGAGLLAPALVAAGFAVGTKTTAAPLAVGALALCAWTLRAHLRPMRAPLALATLTALVVGGFWYARNLVDHGSPLWPFLSLPGGDPVPPAIEDFGTRFAERPGATVAEYGNFWLYDYFGAGILILGTAVASPLVARTRAVAAGAAATAAAVAAWTLAPVTGEPVGGAASGSLYFSLVLSPRYLLPGLVLGLFTLGLAARDGGPRVRVLAAGVLVAGLAVSAEQTFALGDPYVPDPWIPLGGALVGGVVARLLDGPPRWLFHRTTAVAMALVAALALTGVARNLVGRYAAESPNRKLIDFLAARADDGRPVFMAPLMLSVVAGDHLDRRVEMVPRNEPCMGLRARARRGWLTAEQLPGDPLFDVGYMYRCFAGTRPVYDDGKHRVYRLAPARRR